MKHSKIFLAATTCLLAVVGFISAKAHKAFTTISYFTSTHCTVKISGSVEPQVSNPIVGYATQALPSSRNCLNKVALEAGETE